MTPAGLMAFERRLRALATLLAAHRPARSTAQGAVWVALDSVLTLARRFLAAPQGKALESFVRSNNDADGLPAFGAVLPFSPGGVA
jgi:hypothetical protein